MLLPPLDYDDDNKQPLSRYYCWGRRREARDERGSDDEGALSARARPAEPTTIGWRSVACRANRRRRDAFFVNCKAI